MSAFARSSFRRPHDFRVIWRRKEALAASCQSGHNGSRSRLPLLSARRAGRCLRRVPALGVTDQHTPEGPVVHPEGLGRRGALRKLLRASAT
jgi:hypothetical protein